MGIYAPKNTEKVGNKREYIIINAENLVHTNQSSHCESRWYHSKRSNIERVYHRVEKNPKGKNIYESRCGDNIQIGEASGVKNPGKQEEKKGGRGTTKRGVTYQEQMKRARHERGRESGGGTKVPTCTKQRKQIRGAKKL